MGGLVSRAWGWAVVDKNGDIDVKTVSPTERGAIVNWLVVEQKVMITNDWSDGKIYEAWGQRKGAHRVVEVVIER